MTVSARPAALEAFRDELLPAEQELAAAATTLFGALETYRRNNPEFSTSYAHLADELRAHAGRAMDLSMWVGLIAAAVRAADASVQIAGVRYLSADAFDQAIEARTSGDAVEDGHATIVDIRERLRTLLPSAWLTAVYGANHPPDGLDGRYVGAGAIVGPDGRLFPLVIPQTLVDGRTVNLTLSGLPGRDPTTLNGTDPGWRTLEIEVGVTRFADRPSNFDKIAVGAFSATGGNIDTPSWATPQQLATLRISERGVPAMVQPLTPRRSGEFAGFGHPEQPSKVTLQVDGVLVEVDPHRLDTYPRRVRREFARQYGPATTPRPVSRQQAASRAGNVVDLAVGTLQGIDEVANMDRANHAHYQLHFETHPDGRRRARMLVFRAQHLDEVIRILPEHGFVDQDGQLAFTPSTYDDDVGPQVGSRDPDATEGGVPVQLINFRTLPAPPDQGASPR